MGAVRKGKTKTDPNRHTLKKGGGDGRAAYVTIGGVTKAKCEWCKKYGVRQKLIERRVREGMTFEEALKKPVRNGKTPFRLLCESVGIPWQTVYGRIRDRGWSVERALSTPSLAKNSPDCKGRHKVIVDGIAMTAQGAAQKIGASPSVVSYRLRHGWHEDDAATTPPLDTESRVASRWIGERRRELASAGIVI